MICVVRMEMRGDDGGSSCYAALIKRVEVDYSGHLRAAL